MTVAELLLLVPQQIDAEIELAEMPAAEAIVANKAVKAFAPIVQQEFQLPEEVVAEIQEETLALTRGIIRHNVPSGGQKSTAKPKIVEPLDPNVAIDRRNQRLIDEYNNDVAMPETLTVEAEDVAFMALCLKFQKELAEDPIASKEAEFTLKWLQNNEETQPIVEQVNAVDEASLMIPIPRTA